MSLKPGDGGGRSDDRTATPKRTRAWWASVCVLGTPVSGQSTTCRLSSIDPSEFGEGPWKASVRKSIEEYLRDDLQGVIDNLASADVQAIRDARFFTLQASLLLAAGSVGTGTNIERALQLAVNDSFVRIGGLGNELAR